MGFVWYGKFMMVDLPLYYLLPGALLLLNAEVNLSSSKKNPGKPVKRLDGKFFRCKLLYQTRKVYLDHERFHPSSSYSDSEIDPWHLFNTKETRILCAFWLHTRQHFWNVTKIQNLPVCWTCQFNFYVLHTIQNFIDDLINFCPVFSTWHKYLDFACASYICECNHS